MNSNLFQEPRRLWWRCGFVLAAILVVTTFNWFTIEVALHSSEADGSLINLAGRQRMLSQRLSKASLGLAIAQHDGDREAWDAWHSMLESSLQEFSEGHTAMCSAKAAGGLEGHHSELVKYQLAEIEPMFTSIVNHCNTLLQQEFTAADSNVLIAFPPSYQQLAPQAEEYLTQVNQVVGQMALESQLSIIHARMWGHAGVIFVFLLVGSVVLFVLNPTITQLRDEHQHLEDTKCKMEQEHSIAVELNDLLTASIARHDALIATAADAIVITDHEFMIQRVNMAAEEVFQLEHHKLMGKQLCSLIDLRCSELNGVNVQLEGDRPASRLILSGHRTMGLRPDKVKFPAEISVSSTSVNGRTFYTTILRDVTERENMESQLAEARKMEAIGALAAGIAHEINTPMQFVADNVEFVSDSVTKLSDVVTRYEELLRCPQEISWEQRRQEIDQVIEDFDFQFVYGQLDEALADCREGIKRTVTILKAMKTFSHPGDEGLKQVDLNEALQSTLTISRTRWKYSALIDLDLDEELPPVPVYASELHQVLLNLIVNASDAIVERYGEGEHGRIHISTQHTADVAIIEIGDNGSGIPEGIQHRIFDQFFTTKEIGKGTGQGLAICQNVVVNLHGGSLSFESKEGVGTTFRIRLPLNPEENRRHQEQLSEEPVTQPR